MTILIDTITKYIAQNKKYQYTIVIKIQQRFDRIKLENITMDATGNKKEEKRYLAKSVISPEEWNVRFDILNSSLKMILKYMFALCIVWSVIYLAIGVEGWLTSAVKAMAVPVILLVLTEMFTYLFGRFRLSLNDAVVLFIFNFTVMLVTMADFRTHSLMMICLLPLIFGLFLQQERLICVQAVISFAMMAVHYVIVERFSDQVLKGNVMLNGTAIIFDIVVFANMIIQVRKYVQMLDTQTTIDSLTRLHNHECFYEELDAKLEQFKESGEPLCVLIADIDNFKKVNDTYGHAYGDQVLKVLAEIFASETGNKCFAARYGGEEFSMILEMSQSDAITKAQTIRKHFEQSRIPTSDGELHSFTLSVGVALYTGGYKTSSQFFEKADEALYQAKAGGKNRVCIYKGQESE